MRCCGKPDTGPPSTCSFIVHVSSLSLTLSLSMSLSASSLLVYLRLETVFPCQCKHELHLCVTPPPSELGFSCERANSAKPLFLLAQRRLSSVRAAPCVGLPCCTCIFALKDPPPPPFHSRPGRGEQTGRYWSENAATTPPHQSTTSGKQEKKPWKKKTLRTGLNPSLCLSSPITS